MELKIKVLFRLFLVISFFTFSSCEKDLYEDAIKEKSQPKIQKISLSDIARAGTNKKLVTAVERIKSKRKIDQQTQKLVFNDRYGFYIDDENGKYIEADGQQTYTFQIYREYETEKTENIVFKLNEKNEYETFLSKYLLSAEQSEKLSKDEFVELSNVKPEIESLEDPIDPNIYSKCDYFAVDRIVNIGPNDNIVYYVWVPCNSGSTGSSSGTGTGTGTGNIGTGTGNGTGNSGMGTGSGTGTGTGTGNGNGNGNNGPLSGIDTPTPGGIVTTPVVTLAVLFMSKLNLHSKEEFKSLSPESQQVIFNYISATNSNIATVIFTVNHLDLVWMSDQSSQTQISIFNYLVQNNFSLASWDFVNQIIIKMKQNPTLFTSITPFLIEKNIDDSQLDPCSKGVFQEIKNTTNCDFANVLAKLGANGTIYNTTMKTAHNNYTDPNGNIVQVSDPANTTRTTQGTKYDYTIFVNPDFQDKTKLYIATFLLHEVAHAYFFALLDDYTSGVTNSFYELPLLYNAFNTHSLNFNAALTHEEIANSYVNSIAAALKEFQPGLPQQVYDDMAWSGLEKTSIFKTMHPPGSASRQRILNRKAAEQTGHPVGQGTPQEQINYGQPCN